MQLNTMTIPLDDIEVNALGFTNPRTYTGDVTELAASIATHGLTNVPIVWAVTTDESGTPDENGEFARYILLCGHRRLAAIKSLVEQGKGESFANISCSVFAGSLREAEALSVSENEDRENLNPADTAAAVAKLKERYSTQAEVGQALGKSQPWVSNMLQLHYNLCPEVREALRTEKISIEHAKQFARLVTGDPVQPNVERQIEKLNALLASRPDAATKKIAEEEVPKKQRALRNKDECLELRRALARTEGMDPEHKASLQTALRWMFNELDDEQVLTRQELVAEAATPEEARAAAKAEKAAAMEAAKAAAAARKAEQKAADALAKSAAQAEAKSKVEAAKADAKAAVAGKAPARPLPRAASDVAPANSEVAAAPVTETVEAAA